MRVTARRQRLQAAPDEAKIVGEEVDHHRASTESDRMLSAGQ